MNTTPETIELTWSQVRDTVDQVNSELAKQIDALSLGENFTLVKCKYKWGDNILLDGRLYIPNKYGNTVELTDETIPNKLRNKLNYNGAIPMGIVLKNNAELYIHMAQYQIPFSILSKGKLFGLWPSLDNDHQHYISWKIDNIAAGSKSLIMSPKISDALGYKRIKKEFNLKNKIPLNYSDQNNFFYEIIQSENFSEDWHMEVLFFPRKWFDSLRTKRWESLYNYILKYSWDSMRFLRNQISINVLFSCVLNEKNMRPNPYLADVSKYLLCIAQGGYPAYRFILNEESGPIKKLQSIFSDIYNLKYSPTMMALDYVSKDEDSTVYYSLETPTLLEFSPRSKKVRNKLNDLREIKQIIENVISYILEEKSHFRGSEVNRLINLINFDFIHTDIDRYGEINQSKHLEKNDEFLAKSLVLQKNKNFCDTSPFLRGCVKIDSKTDKSK